MLCNLHSFKNNKKESNHENRNCNVFASISDFIFISVGLYPLAKCSVETIGKVDDTVLYAVVCITFYDAVNLK